MAPTALSLDLDGTVWDSAPWYARIIGRLSAEPSQPAEERLRSGANVIRLIQDYGVSKQSFVLECAQEIKGLRLYPGVRETLSILLKKAVPIGAASSLPGSLVNPMLEGSALEPFFATVVHAGNCRPPKPNPRPLLMSFEGLGVY